MNPSRLAFFLVLLVSPFGLDSMASTIRVPQDQPTIQAGILAANSGDTVLVAPGTYHENIDFKGKAITVTSSAGPGVTIIDGGQPGAPGLAGFARPGSGYIGCVRRLFAFFARMGGLQRPTPVTRSS